MQNHILSLSTVLALLSGPSAAQLGQSANGNGLPDRTLEPPSVPESVWYAGDTHEHFQVCSGLSPTLEEIQARMEAEELAIAHILVWSTEQLPFTRFVCLVTGEPDPISTPERILQYAVEGSGLDCDKWGHVIALGVGPDRARIASGSLASGDCADMPGLGLGCGGGDGTGVLVAPLAQHFLGAPGVVCGYAHSAWPLGLYHPEGLDWHTRLVTSGFTTDAVCLDPDQNLAVPNIARLIGVEERVPPEPFSEVLRAFFPMLGAVDAVLGEVQFFETTTLTQDWPYEIHPPANWFGHYYKLLSAGVRIAVAGGTDRVCPLPGNPEHPATHVLLDEPFSYEAWTRGLARGHTTLGVAGVRLDLRVNGKRVGEELLLDSGAPAAAVSVELRSADGLEDSIELIVDGQVRDSQSVVVVPDGLTRLSFDPLLFSESTWVAARLASQRAHTAAIYVIVDGKPIGDCRTAEYWMLWCDIVAQAVLEHPELELFGCQEPEALLRIARARRAFKSYRDLDGFDPAWKVDRFGLSTPACRGPIAIGVTGPLLAGQTARFTCLNAPPATNGWLVVGRAPDPAGTCIDGVRSFVDVSKLVRVLPALSTRSGYAEVELSDPPADAAALYAQFLWVNPADCSGSTCGPNLPMLSTSDALELAMHARVGR